MELGIVPTYVWRWRFNVVVAMIIISSLRQSSLTCERGKIFLFSSHKNEIGVLLLLHLISDRNPHIFNCRKICRGGKNLVPSCPGVAFATPCHPMATGLGFIHFIYFSYLYSVAPSMTALQGAVLKIYKI